jgi:asparagine synthase (glutamine-hydrolysing)
LPAWSPPWPTLSDLRARWRDRVRTRPDLEALARIGDALAPRGPDGAGDWHYSSVALVHRRLKIIDLTPHGDQPLVDSELGLVIAFNGCVYNHNEPRAQLIAAGYAFRSTSDTEVILKAFHHWGAERQRAAAPCGSPTVAAS